MPWTKEDRRAYNKVYFQVNRERLLSKRKLWEEVNPNYNLLWLEANPWSATFNAVKQRCNNPNHIGFKNYGGRGIKCLLTLADLEAIYKRDNAQLMTKPSIDRIDGNGHYETSNCRYIELSENIKRSNIKRKFKND